MVRFGLAARRGSEKGFTLIELLVVIAMIGTLIGLLLPAVQKVREAANRASCANNLKQIGLALHSHHDTYNRLPPGGAMDQPPFGTEAATVRTGSRWGSSWMVYLLPYIEQGNLYRNWQFYGNSGSHNSNNADAASGLEIKMYFCPSSPLPHFPALSSLNNAATANYVAVSGAAHNLIPGFNETRYNNLPWGGEISAGGVLFPNGKLSLANIADGLSNTIAVSEQGNYLTDTAGVRQDWRASQSWGWILGVRSTGVPPNFDNTGGDNRQPNMTTIRYPINHKPAAGWPNDISGMGVGANVNCSGANTPLNSTHSGGVNVLFCDGSVRFLSDSTPLSVLAELATRDDGQVLPNY